MSFIICLALLCLYLSFYRLVFFLNFKNNDIIFNEVLKAFYLGFKFDIRYVLLLLLPLFIYWLSNGKRKKVYAVYSTVIGLIFCLFCLFDFYSFDYLNTRLSFEMVKFLKTPKESFLMLWQSYPIILLLIGVISFCLITFKTLTKLVRPNKANLKFKLSLSFIFLVSLYGKFSWYPLRWSESFFSTNEFVSYIGLNPLQYFLETSKFTKEKKIELKDIEPYREILEKYFQADFDRGNFTREIENFSHLLKKKRPNVVLIVLESLASFKTGLMGSDLNATPVLDDLAKESYFFPNHFVSVQATARAIYTLVTGVTDVSRIKSASRNPMMINKDSLINKMKDYKKYYFLGGSANWGNIRGIFTHNIKDISILEEGDYEGPKVDVWGVSDYHLFKKAHSVFEKEKQPFFALIQSSGFHRPYTIPDFDHGFKPRKFSSEEKKSLPKKGFDNPEEYNSLKFQDYNLGKFLEWAKKGKYFNNTLFIVLGDHGLPIKKTEFVSKRHASLNLENFHTPLLFYGPKIIDPGVNNKYVSNLDIFPTVLSLLGMKVKNKTLGRNIFSLKAKNPVFSYYWYHKPATFSLYNEDYHFTGKLGGKNIFYSKESWPKNVYNEENKAKEFEDLSYALYYLSKFKLTLGADY